MILEEMWLGKPSLRGWELLLNGAVNATIPLTEVRSCMDFGDWEGKKTRAYSAFFLPWGIVGPPGRVGSPHLMSFQNQESGKFIAFCARVGKRGRPCDFGCFATQEDEVEFWRLYAALDDL